MGLLDKPSIAEEVNAIRRKRLEVKDKKQLMKLMGKAPLRKYKRQFKVSKKMRKEWGERMKFFKSI